MFSVPTNYRTRAIDQMQKFKPDDHEENRSVAPLVQFFELVHIGDTIQSMVQVYFDKELVSVTSSLPDRPLTAS
jgi:hypothetical protein